MGEVFPTKGTLVWFFSCVCSLMSGKVHALPETFSTSRTFKEFLLYSVGSVVYKKGGTVINSLPTLRERVKSLFLMGSFMNDKM